MNVLWIAIVSLVSNIFLGIKRIKFNPPSIMWFFLIHASIIWILPLRICLKVPSYFTFMFIFVAIIGQFIGAKIGKRINKKTINKNLRY